MTPDSRRENVQAELRRGRESLEAAQVLLSAGLRADAVSRAYYAAFHHARALRLTIGQEPGSHGGFVRLLHRDFVRPGLLDPDVARLLSRLQQYRHDADYTAEFIFSPAGAADEVKAARDFTEAVEAILSKEGWIDQWEGNEL